MVRVAVSDETFAWFKELEKQGANTAFVGGVLLEAAASMSRLGYLDLYDDGLTCETTRGTFRLNFTE